MTYRSFQTLMFWFCLAVAGGIMLRIQTEGASVKIVVGFACAALACALSLVSLRNQSED